MRTFYADYENVQSTGLEGIEQLTTEDKVYIFYSIHAETMKIGVVRQILECAAEVEFVEVDTGTDNALDFQLVARLFMDVNKDNAFYIISRDAGFDAAVKMGNRCGYDNIQRIPNLLSLFQPEMEIFDVIEESIVQNRIDEIISEKCGKRTCEKYGELIITGLRSSENKNQFYQFFRKNLGDAEGGDLYRNIRSKFDEMKTWVI